MPPKNPLLAARLAETGLTQQQLATAAGIHWTSVSKILNLHQVPTPETAARIARALNTTPHALGFRSEGGA